MIKNNLKIAIDAASKIFSKQLISGEISSIGIGADADGDDVLIVRATNNNIQNIPSKINNIPIKIEIGQPIKAQKI